MSIYLAASHLTLRFTVFEEFPSYTDGFLLAAVAGTAPVASNVGNCQNT